MQTKTPWAALLLIIATTVPLEADSNMPAGPIPVTEYDIVRHIRRVLSRMAKDDRWERAPQLAQIIVDESKRYKIDPLTLTVIIQAESTFREGLLRGKKEELGLTQLVGASRQCDRTANLETSRGQVRGGACWFAFALRKCGTELGALHAYQSGRCESRAYGPLYRLRLIKKARARIWHRRKEIEDLINPKGTVAPNGKSKYAERVNPSLTVKEQLSL